VRKESKMWSALKAANRGVFLKRVENGVSIGFPDIYFVGGLAELKVSSGKRKFVIRSYTLAQRLWAREHVRAGGLHYLIVLHMQEFYWFRGHDSYGPDLLSSAEEAIALAFHVGKHWPLEEVPIGTSTFSRDI